MKKEKLPAQQPCLLAGVLLIMSKYLKYSHISTVIKIMPDREARVAPEELQNRGGAPPSSLTPTPPEKQNWPEGQIDKVNRT